MDTAGSPQNSPQQAPQDAPAVPSGPTEENGGAPARGIGAVQAAQLSDAFESSTSAWLRRQAAILEMDAYRYLTPETESQGVERIRRELAEGREIIPTRVLYRLALHFYYQARRGATDALWTEGPYLFHNL